MGERLFQVPISLAEIAQDRLAYELWCAEEFDDIAEDDEAVLTAEELGARLDTIKRQLRDLESKRRKWIDRAAKNDTTHTLDLIERIVTQRSKGNTDQFAAMMAAAGKVHPLAKIAGRSNRKLFYVPRDIRKPFRESRDAARVSGAKRYIGKPCKRCSGTLRYTRNSHCVRCDRADSFLKPRRFNPVLQQHRDNRAAARDAGLRTFEGTPCANCGSTARYVSNNNCQHCDSKRKKPHGPTD